MNPTLNLNRLLMGYLIAPLTTPLFFLGFNLVTGGWSGVRRASESLFFATLFAYLVAFVLGTLLVLILGRLQKTNGLQFAIGGMIIGSMMGVIFPILLLWFAIAGALSAWVFWVFVYWKAEAS